MRRRCVVGLVLVAMVVGACGAGADTDEASVDTAEASAETSQSTVETADGADETSESSASEVDQGATPMAASSPIGAFFADGGGFDSAIAEYRTRVEEAIFICMAAEGFEFARTESNFGDNPVEERQNDLTAREWTTEYGFGISTSFDSVAQNQTSDPNTALFLSMTENEREIWIETLTGGGFEATQGNLNSKPLEEQGCIGQALIETGGQDAIEGLDGFGDVYDEGQQALFDRREMVEVIDAWARCMSEAGYPGYAELDAPEDDISGRFQEITAPLSAAIDELTPEEGQALIAGDTFDIERLPNLDVAALRALQAEEIDLAVADLDCYEAEVQDTYEPLRDEFENGLLVEYAVEFDALKNIGS